MIFRSPKNALSILKSDFISELVTALLTATVLCCLLFPDALFLNAGLSQTSQFIAARTNEPVATFYPQPPHRSYVDAYSDAGGALWQSEPGQQFFRYCLKSGESPYWNPYSGAGQLGPETIVDVKFSFQSLLLALLNGSQTAFNAVLIGSYFVAICFMYLFCSHFLRVSTVAAICSCIAFAFCGYSTSTLGSNTSQTYLYYPLLLCAIAHLCSRVTTFRLITLFVIDTVILSVTFAPTCFLTLLTGHLIGISYAVSLKKYSWRGLACLTGLQGAALMFAFFALGFLYFPIFETLQTVDSVAAYNARQFVHSNYNSVLSFFSNKHFWEEYCPPSLVGGQIQITNGMLNFGAAASIVAACAFAVNGHLRPIALTCLTLFALTIARVYGIPPVDQLVEFTPGFRSIGQQYWLICTASTYVVLVPLGIESIKLRLPRVWIPAAFTTSIILTATAYLYLKLGFVQPNADYKQFCVLVICAVTLSAFFLIALTAWQERFVKAACVLLLALILGELIHDIMYFRYRKTDYFKNGSVAVKFIRQNAGNWRLVNLNEGIMSAEQGSAFQVQQIETMNMNIIPNYEAFFYRHFVNKSVPAWVRFCTFFLMVERADKDWKPMLDLSMFNLLGVRYIVVPAPWPKTITLLEDKKKKKIFSSLHTNIYENPHAYPRAFAVRAVEDSPLISMNSGDSGRAIAYSADKLFLQEAKNAGIAFGSSNKIPPATVDSTCKITGYHNDNVSIKTEVEEPSVIVLTDNWHPNWTATVDGKPTRIGLVDETFRAVIVPKGSHQIEMHYRPKSLTAGLSATLLALTLLAAAIIFSSKLDVFFQRISKEV